MIKFVEYLINHKEYHAYESNKSGNCIETNDISEYSSLRRLNVKLISNNNNYPEILYGLNQVGYPPGLIYPHIFNSDVFHNFHSVNNWIFSICDFDIIFDILKEPNKYVSLKFSGKYDENTMQYIACKFPDKKDIIKCYMD